MARPRQRRRQASIHTLRMIVSSQAAAAVPGRKRPKVRSARSSVSCTRSCASASLAVIARARASSNGRHGLTVSPKSALAAAASLELEEVGVWDICPPCFNDSRAPAPLHRKGDGLPAGAARADTGARVRVSSLGAAVSSVLLLMLSAAAAPARAEDAPAPTPAPAPDPAPDLVPSPAPAPPPPAAPAAAPAADGDPYRQRREALFDVAFAALASG